MMNTVTWKIGGEAGFGIMTVGHSFSVLAARHGYQVFDYIEYPSLVRGGHNVYSVCVGKEVYSQEKGVDLLVALNQETIDLHKTEMKKNGLIMYDKDHASLDAKECDELGIIGYPVPFVELTKKAGASKLMENNVAMGACIALLDMDLSVLDDLLTQAFGKKGNEIVEENKKVAKLGHDYVKKHPVQQFSPRLTKVTSEQRMIVSGNQAVVLGALQAGCKFYSAYPMTPASSALHYFAKVGDAFGVVVKHVEDEISAINMAIGASYTGVRAMTGSSGGGFSLMVEGLGLAGITESPIVILMVSRAGPASGMPTWYGQGDLKFLIHASQDEFPRIILAPGDVEEAYHLTSDAFNLAEKYQTPVFVLSDKNLAEGHQSMLHPNQSSYVIDRGKLMSWKDGHSIDGYLRYKDSVDGVSERALPGMKKAVFTANSYEHNEYGFSTEEIEERVKQVNRRNRKLKPYIDNFPEQKVYGDDDADVTIIAWGSTKGPVRDALRRLKNEEFSKKVNFLHITHVWPFPEKQVQEMLSRAKKTLLVEGNSQAQLGQLIKEFTGKKMDHIMLRYDGRPFYPEDIMEKVKEILS